MNAPPKELFAPDGAGNVVRLEIRLCLDPAGNVWSLHLVPPEAEQILLTWPGGGTRQVGHAFLTEALRRETFNTVLTLLSSGTNPVVRTWADADEAGRRKIEAEVGRMAGEVFDRTARKMAPDTAREILTMMSRDLGPLRTSGDEPPA